MSKKDKKMGKGKASILKASLPPHLANRIVNVKVKKPKKKDWLTFSAETDYRINARLLQAFQDNYAEEKAKAEAALAEAFVHVPDPERPVQFVGPRELVEAQALVEQTKNYLEVREDKGDLAEFEKMPDGTFRVSIEGQSDDRFQNVWLTPEQFAAFKQWVMEN